MLTSLVKNTSDLMTIALLAEREAISRYTDLAVLMRQSSNDSAADLFERMVIEEKEHERLLLLWMVKENIHQNMEISPVKWKDPLIATIYNDEARDPDNSTPYKALAYAVHNEEIAFKFYTQVTAESENKKVKKYAEILAREELGHAALLRAERRKAYHAERDSGDIEPLLDPKAIHNETDLLTAAVYIDEYLSDGMEFIALGLPKIKPLVKETKLELNKNKSHLHSAVEASESILNNLTAVNLYNLKMSETAKSDADKIHRLATCCDRSFAFYDAIVTTTKDEKTMLMAQEFTSLALDRIGALKEILDDEVFS